MTGQVETLTPERFASASALLADAFFTNPAHVYLCPDPDTRHARLEWLLGGNLRLQPDLGASFCLVEASRVDAMGFWTRSTAPEIGTLDRIRAGLLGLPFRLGWNGLRRVLEVTGEIERQLGRALGERPHWYLNNMVVAERLRGSGVGTRLLREQLPLVSSQEPGWAIALSTQRPENVTFYQRFGFRVAHEASIGGETGAFHNWTMVCEPVARDTR